MNKGAVAGMIVPIIVAAIFGVIGLQMWNSMVTDMTTTYTVTNESLGTVTVNVAVSLAHDNLQSFDGAHAYNASTGDFIADLTSSDYTVDMDAGTFTLTNSAYDQTNITVDYTWAKDSYMENSLVRLIVSNLPIMLAVGLLVLVVSFIR